MAQQFQESRGRHQLESSSGAKGVYQNKPRSVMDVVNYLSFLKKSSRDLPNEKRCDYSGPNNISLEEAEKITDLFLKKADYGRATGKLYLLSMHDKDSAYNRKPNPDVFRSKSPEEQQRLLLLAYHDGPSRRLKSWGASKEAREYVRLAKKHMRTIADIRKQLNEAGVSKNINYAIFKILQELDRKENREKEEGAITYWLEKIKKAQAKKWEQSKNIKKSLSNEEIRKIFA